MTGIAPTIGGRRPGFGLRVRKDGNRAFSAADAECRCGQFSESVTGDAEVERLVVRFGRHQRDDCAIPEVREAAARHYARLQQSLSKRRRK